MSRGAAALGVAAVVVAGLIAASGGSGGGPMLVATTGASAGADTVAAGALAADDADGGGCVPGDGGLPAPRAPRKDSLVNKPLPIPADMQALYQKEGKEYGIPWELLAGVGMSETGHWRNRNTSSAGARGPMQFMPGTWAGFGVDGNGDGVKTVLDPADAVPAAARYLKASGAPGDVRKALFAYNRATWYGNDVLFYAQSYGAKACAAPAARNAGAAPGGAPAAGVGAQTAATRPAEPGLAATTLRGLRQGAARFPQIKVWGGNGPRPIPSDHSTGHATDGMIPKWNTPAGNAFGWQVARWYVANAGNLRIKYVIWDDQIWKKRVGAWRPYTHPGGPTRNVTLRHLDHVHVSYE